MSENLYYVVRLVNIGLAMICVVWLLFKANRHWSIWGHETKAYVTSLGFFALTVLYGTAEVLVEHVQGGPRVFLTTIALGCLSYALWHTKGRTISWHFHRH